MWLPDDADAVVALIEYEESLHVCGVPREEAFDKRFSFAYEVRTIRCHACAAIEKEQERRSKDGAFDMAGVSFAVVEDEESVIRD